MDTVVFGDGWTRDPLGAEEAEGRIYGRGSCDMKSGLACALSAFRKTALAVQAGAKLKRPLALLCTVDEEADMAGIGQAIECGLVRKDDWVMDLEPTGGQIQMAHKGRLWLEIDVQGVTAHASRPEQGADAIAAAGELIARARRDFLARAGDGDPVLGRATITFGQITGGYQPYVVPDRCRLWVDMRLAPAHRQRNRPGHLPGGPPPRRRPQSPESMSPSKSPATAPASPFTGTPLCSAPSKTPVKPSRAKSWRRASSPATPIPPSSPGPWGTSTASPTAPGTWSRPTNPTNLWR